jgi:hypothetical protein
MAEASTRWKEWRQALQGEELEGSCAWLKAARGLAQEVWPVARGMAAMTRAIVTVKAAWHGTTIAAVCSVHTRDREREACGLGENLK